MHSFTVYFVDYAKQEKKAIGRVFERRTKYRPDNFLGLLKIAKKTYALTPQEAFHVVLGKNALKGTEQGI